LPTETEKPSPARRAFLTGDYFTRHGRARLGAEYAEQGQPLAAVSLDRQACLGWQRITCLGCRDACPENAIAMVANLEPRIDLQLCNSCCKCVAVCPVNAIRAALPGNH
jgi:ferredoxin